MQVDPNQYWESRLRKTYSLQGVGSIDMGSAYNHWLYRVRRHAFLRTLAQMQMASRKGGILDVGSGTGFYVDLWKEAGFRNVTASDLTRIAVKKLRARRAAPRILRLDIGAPLGPSLHAERFDIVSAFDVFFHILDSQRYQRAMRNVGRLLKPGGLFFYSDNLAPRKVGGRHEATRTEAQILRAARLAGLTPVAFRPVFFVMNDPVRRPGKILWRTHRLIRWLASVPGLGGMVGAGLYPLEILMTGLCHRGAGTEVVVFQKRGKPRCTS